MGYKEYQRHKCGYTKAEPLHWFAHDDVCEGCGEHIDFKDIDCFIGHTNWFGSIIRDRWNTRFGPEPMPHLKEE